VENFICQIGGPGQIFESRLLTMSCRRMRLLFYLFYQDGGPFISKSLFVHCLHYLLNFYQHREPRCIRRSPNRDKLSQLQIYLHGMCIFAVPPRKYFIAAGRYSCTVGFTLLEREVLLSYASSTTGCFYLDNPQNLSANHRYQARLYGQPTLHSSTHKVWLPTFCENLNSR